MQKLHSKLKHYSINLGATLIPYLISAIITYGLLILNTNQNNPNLNMLPATIAYNAPYFTIGTPLLIAILILIQVTVQDRYSNFKYQYLKLYLPNAITWLLTLAQQTVQNQLEPVWTQTLDVIWFYALIFNVINLITFAYQLSKHKK